MKAWELCELNKCLENKYRLVRERRKKESAKEIKKERVCVEKR